MGSPATTRARGYDVDASFTSFLQSGMDVASSMRDEPGSGTEQLGLGGGELVVRQNALLMQRRKLVQLVDHR